jgi:hypothetical protein
VRKHTQDRIRPVSGQPPPMQHLKTLMTAYSDVGLVSTGRRTLFLKMLPAQPGALRGDRCLHRVWSLNVLRRKAAASDVTVKDPEAKNYVLR